MDTYWVTNHRICKSCYSQLKWRNCGRMNVSEDFVFLELFQLVTRASPGRGDDDGGDHHNIQWGAGNVMSRLSSLSLPAHSITDLTQHSISCQAQPASLISSAVVRSAVLWTSVISQNQETCHLSSLSWHIVCLENRPQISEGLSQEIICSRGEASAGLLIQCVGNLWFGSILSLMTVTWTNQIWQKIISWPSFDLQILKTRIISMLGARLVNR